MYTSSVCVWGQSMMKNMPVDQLTDWWDRVTVVPLAATCKITKAFRDPSACVTGAQETKHCAFAITLLWSNLYGSRVLNSSANLTSLLYLNKSFTKEHREMSLGALTTQVNMVSPPVRGSCLFPSISKLDWATSSKGKKQQLWTTAVPHNA